MKIKFIFRKAITLLSLAAFCFAYSPVTLAVGLPPISLAQMYSYASSGNVRALRAAVQRGLNIDSRDRYGNTGLCHAILQNNCTAYNAFRASGANPHASCIQNIPSQQYDRFMAQSCTADITDTPRQAYNKFNEGEFIVAKRTWIIGGILLAGGLVALFSGGGGGGGGVYFVPYTEPDDSLAKYAGTKNPNTPETSPYVPIKYFADNNKTITNKVNGSEMNDFSISNNSTIKINNAEGKPEDKKLVDLIDLNGNILDYAAYLQVGMKARNNSSVINGTAADGFDAPMITIGDAAVGMAADDLSQALNYGTLKVLAQNAAFGMVAGNHSTATNQGGEINLQFKGYNDKDTIVGMYADTYSSLVNNGTITGNTIDVSDMNSGSDEDSGSGSGSGSGTGTGTGSGSEGGSDTGTTGEETATANAGTIIGMQVRTVNEVPYPNLADPVTASNNGSITLNAQSDSAAIKTSLVGMGGYLDKSFLDGTKLIRRASSLYLLNGANGKISLNYTLSGTGTYAPEDNTLLKGNGGIMGMRSDAKTNAINKGEISLIMSAGVDNAGAGMQAVHGGTISNENIISVVGGMGNYGMLSVRGQGSNSEIDSLTPTLTNTASGSITVASTNGFGMASFNGGVVTNNGRITMLNTSTGMRTNTGTLVNGEGATITLENSGSGMVLKSGDPTTDEEASDGEDTGDTGNTDGTDGSSQGGSSSGGTSTDDENSSGGSSNTGSSSSGNNSTGESGASGKQDLSRSEAINNGTITINKADGAQGIFIEDGKATNSGSGIFITNTSKVPAAASYGIKAEAGKVQNNSTINMNVLVSADGSTSVDSYGIYSDSAEITNGVLGNITFQKRGTGIATTSGRVYNMGNITLQQGGTGISSSSGDVYNVENASIFIDDNNTAASTGIVAQAGKITNDGTITITNGNGATGIKAGLWVDNNNEIELTGRNVTGIELTGKDAIATNDDEITITSNGISDGNYGMKAGDSAVNATITNNKNISFTGSDDYSSTQQVGYGISMVDGTAYNKGNITFDNMFGYGMYTLTGTVNNNGSIVMNSGGTGLYANGTGGQAINTQQIAINIPNSNDKALTYGIYVDGGASGSNTAGAEIYIKSNTSPALMLAKAFGVYVNKGSGTNQGAINIDGSNSTGMAYVGTGTGGSDGADGETTTEENKDTLINLEGGEINLTGSNNIGMSAAGAVATNNGTINVGTKSTDGTITQSTNSIGMQTTGGLVFNQNNVNIYSSFSVGLQSDAEGGVITNNGIIYVDDNAVNSYAFLSKAGTAVNGITGSVVNNQSNTDYMRAEGGNLLNNGTLSIADSASNVNVMHVAKGGNATNYGDKTSGIYGIINVGSAGGTGINNIGMLLDGDVEGSIINDGIINIYSQKSYGMYINNENGELTNNGTINVQTGATGSVALYAEKGKINNAKDGTINMKIAGTVMQTKNGEITNEGTIELEYADSIAMNVTDSGSATNTGTLDVDATSSYAMHAEDGATATLTNQGSITIEDGATGSFGMYGANAEITNDISGTINVLQSGATAMFTKVGSLINKGTIKLNASDAVGMSVVGNGGSAENVADAEIILDNSGKAMYVSGSSSLTNNGNIQINSNDAYAMYAANGGTATNGNKIVIGDNYTGSYAMYGTSGSKLINDGTIKVGSSSISAIYATDSSVENNGGIEVDSTQDTAAGIYVSNSTGSGNITNAGTINVEYMGTNSSANAYGILVNSASSLDVSNSGDISVSSSNGKAYGMFASNVVQQTNSQNITVSGKNAYGIYGGVINNNGGTITVTGTGNGASYGIYGAGGNISNQSGTISVNAEQAYGMALYGSGTASNTGILNVTATGSGSSYGIYGSSITNGGNLTVNGTGSTIAYGLYGVGGTVLNQNQITISSGQAYGIATNGSGTATNAGQVSITATGSGTSYGMFGGNLTNSGTLTVTGSGNGVSYGMSSSGGSVSNTSNIEVKDGQAYGIALNGSGTATNSGTITVTGSGSGTSYGMYGSNGASLVNAAGATINVNAASAIGMYATGSGSSIYNYGTINVNGASLATEYPGASSSTNPDTDNTGCTAAGCGNFIQVADGATFVNSGQVISTSALNFNLMSAANSGTYVLAPKGSYIAPEHSGPVTASADIVMEGNKTTYVNEDSFIGTDAGLKLSSGSYLFDAYLVTNEDGNQDVVMIMKEFSDVVDNSSVANFLTNNYTLGTNMDMYSILKSAPDASSFTAAVAGQMGLDIVPSFAKQNMDIVKAVNRHMSQTLFANQSAQDVRAMFDFVYDYREQNDVDMLSGYEDKALSAYAMFDRKYNNNFRYGLGVSFTRYESDYDNGSERDEIIAQVLTPLIYTTEGLKAIAMPRLGIGWGEYNRRADGFDNKADTKNYYYGITNEVRKEFDLGAVVLEPTAEFNVLGMYQDSTKEKNGLEVKSANNLSVEGGLGLYVRKSFSIKDENDLTLRAGGTWYHEFNNPYQAARARIAGMVGSYQMDSYDAERDRGILTFRMDYKHEGFDFYFEANKFLEESDGYALSAGMGYKF